MTASILMQAWLAWNFIRFQIKRWRENQASNAPTPKKKRAKKDQEKKKKRCNEEEEEASGTEHEANGSAKLKKT